MRLSRKVHVVNEIPAAEKLRAEADRRGLVVVTTHFSDPIRNMVTVSVETR